MEESIARASPHHRREMVSIRGNFWSCPRATLTGKGVELQKEIAAEWVVLNLFWKIQEGRTGLLRQEEEVHPLSDKRKLRHFSDPRNSRPSTVARLSAEMQCVPAVQGASRGSTRTSMRTHMNSLQGGVRRLTEPAGCSRVLSSQFP